MTRIIDYIAIGAINHLLAQATWASSRLAPFRGRTAELTMGPRELAFVISDDGLLNGTDLGSGDCDVRIELPADTPFRLLAGRNEVFRAARVSGSAEFADTLGFVLRNLRWDAAEDASRLLGDVLSQRLLGALRAGAEWQRQAVLNAGRNFAEYATFEAGLIPAAAEISRFAADVGELEGMLARLEERARCVRPD